MESRTNLFDKVLLISFFVFLLFVSVSVHAEDKSTDAALANAVSSVAESPPLAENIETDAKEPKAAKPPKHDKSDNVTASSMAAASAAGSWSNGGSFLSLPTVTNSTFTGSAVMNIPLEVPPGRGGIAPNLSLTYRSMQKNGWLGVGWELDMGAIQRATKFGVSYPATLPGTDFVAIVNGSTTELVPRGDWGANYYFGAKIEGQFSKHFYNLQTGGWEVTDKNGTKYYYGSTSLSRQDSALGVFKWCLDKVQDTNGNYMTVSYYKDNGEIYMDRIDYTGNSNAPVLSPTNYAKFYRELRSDAPDMYVPNFRVQTRYRLKAIEVRASGSPARVFKLTYTNNGTTTNRSVLTTLQQYGSDAAVNSSTGDITGVNLLTIFSGGYDTGGFGLTTPAYNPPALAASITGGYRTNSDTPMYMLNGDFNGDGKMDYMWTPNNGDRRWLISYGTDNGLTTPDYNSPALQGTIAGGYATYHANDPYGSKYMRTGDFNGDGKTDYMWMPYNGDGRWLVAYGTATGFAIPSYNSPALPAALPGGTLTRNTEEGIFMLNGDFNGDGKTDYMWSPHLYYDSWWPRPGSWYVAYGTGTGFTLPNDNNPALPEALPDGTPTWYLWEYGSCMRTGDFNGDGKTDYMWVPSSSTFSGDGRWLAAYGTTTGFTTPSYSSPALPATVTGGYGTWNINDAYMRNGDFNGDGKTDYMWIPSNGDGRWLVAYATGTAGTEFTIPSYSSPALPATITGGYATYHSNGAYMRNGDFNGDGKTDYMWMPPSPGDGRWLVAYASGTGFTSPSYSNPALPATISGGYVTNHPNGAYMRNGDFNGDGKTDYMWIPSNGDGRWLLAYANVADHLPEVLISAGNAIGGSHTLAYTPSTRFTNTLLPFSVQVVKSITANDGNGNNSIALYDYLYGYYDIPARDFRGFGYVKQTNPDSTKVESWFLQDSIYKGLMSQQRVWDAANNKYTETYNTYGSTTPYTGCNFPYLSITDNYLWDGTPTYKQVRSFFLYDIYGNVTRKYNYGDYAVGGDEKIEDIDYTYDTSRWIVSLPSHTYLKDGSGNIKAQTWYVYYPGTVNVQTKTDWLNGGTNPATGFVYNAYGNLTSTTDPNGNVTTTSYGNDPTYTYPTAVTNQYFGFTASKTYDYRYGKPATETDFNNNARTYQYDVFGRLTKVINPYDTSSTYGTQSISYDNFGQGVGTQRITTRSTEQSGTGNYIWKEIYFDGFGRTIKTRSEGPDGKVIVMGTIYNTMGRITNSSLPYFENLDTSRWITYAYDPLGRISQVTNPDGKYLTRSYVLGKTVLIDANFHKKEEDRDAYGRVVQVREYTGVNPTFTLYATTNYQYNQVDNLVQVTDTAGNVTNISYDTLGRKTSMTDPDMGFWQYSYDANGNLRFQTDAKNQTIEFQYDALNRLKLKNYPTGTDVIYTYDEIFTSNYKGKLTTVSDAAGTTKFYYDMLGRTLKTMKTVNGVNYTIETSYDALSRTASIKYPDLETVNYTYNTGGSLWQAGGYGTYTGYNALGQVGNIAYGNGAGTAYQYFPSNNRLSSITTTSQGQGLLNRSYLYDNVGNIQTITDNLDGSRTQNFTYDALNRLTQAQSTAYGTLSHQYNQIGNMTSNSQVGTYIYPTNHIRPHAVSQAGSYSYQYDANGNMTSKNGTTIAYDYDNRPTSIGATTLVYDYAGQRVKKNGTVYIGNIYECTAGVCTKYIFAGGSRIAMKSGSTVSYYHTDHLGSSSIMTNAAGVKVEEIHYYPYGATRINTGSVNVKHKFTGQEEDAEVGLYYYGARYYDPTIGRFISADTIVPNPSDPQSLNRYTYCLNNPIIYIDPTGHFSLKKFFNSAFIGASGGAAFVLSGGNPVVAGMVAGAVGGGISGGGIESIVQGTAFGGVLGGFGGAIYDAYGATGAYAMLGTGAAVATVTGGLDSLAYYSGGVLGGIAGAYAAEDSMANWDSPQEVGGPHSSQRELINKDPNGERFTNPTGGDMRGCDSQGCGNYGAGRGNRIHLGIDIESTPGQDVSAPLGGKAFEIRSKQYPGVQVVGKKYTGDALYIKASNQIVNAGAKGLTVNAGDVIGTALDITGRYPGITNHIHFQLRQNGSSLFINPKPFIFSR